MSEKILFTDLDGTLLNSAKKVSPGMQLLLSKMVLAGNRLVLTSGRALPSVLKVAKNAGLLFPDTVIIAANGNEVYDCDTKTFLMRKSVPIEIAEDIISMAQEESLYLHSYSDTCVVAPKDGVEVKHYCSRTGMEYQVSDDLLKTIGHAPCKLLAIDMENHGRLEAFRSRIQEKYGDKISAIFSNPIYLEIFDKTAGKGNAVRFVCEHFQIPLSNSVAAGDAETPDPGSPRRFPLLQNTPSPQLWNPQQPPCSPPGRLPLLPFPLLPAPETACPAASKNTSVPPHHTRNP